MHTITDHKCSDANSTISITCDEQSNGGASHVYDISFECGDVLENEGGTSVQRIKFQKGAIGEVGLNGITDEVLVAVLIDRLRKFQSGPFPCRENALALTRLQEAMHWMQHRTNDRVKRGVEGTSAA